MVCQNLVPLVNIKIAAKWMVIPPKNGINRYWSIPIWESLFSGQFISTESIPQTIFPWHDTIFRGFKPDQWGFKRIRFIQHPCSPEVLELAMSGCSLRIPWGSMTSNYNELHITHINASHTYYIYTYIYIYDCNCIQSFHTISHYCNCSQ